MRRGRILWAGEDVSRGIGGEKCSVPGSPGEVVIVEVSVVVLVIPSELHNVSYPSIEEVITDTHSSPAWPYWDPEGCHRRYQSTGYPSSRTGIWTSLRIHYIRYMSHSVAAEGDSRPPRVVLPAGLGRLSNRGRLSGGVAGARRSGQCSSERCAWAWPWVVTRVSRGEPRELTCAGAERSVR